MSRPESADQYEFSVEDGDVILLATDGLFDNVPDKLLVQVSWQYSSLIGRELGILGCDWSIWQYSSIIALVESWQY